MCGNICNICNRIQPFQKVPASDCSSALQPSLHLSDHNIYTWPFSIFLGTICLNIKISANLVLFYPVDEPYLLLSAETKLLLDLPRLTSSQLPSPPLVVMVCTNKEPRKEHISRQQQQHARWSGWLKVMMHFGLFGLLGHCKFKAYDYKSKIRDVIRHLTMLINENRAWGPCNPRSRLGLRD